ncbi:MAG: hypothetical protein ACJA1H_001069 [Glaciecola sp.]|jgi:hypothetical protein
MAILFAFPECNKEQRFIESKANAIQFEFYKIKLYFGEINIY